MRAEPAARPPLEEEDPHESGVRERSAEEDDRHEFAVAATVTVDAAFEAADTRISIEMPPERAERPASPAIFTRERAQLPSLPNTMVTRLPEALRPSRVPNLAVELTLAPTPATASDPTSSDDGERTLPDVPIRSSHVPGTRASTVVALTNRLSAILEPIVASIDVHDVKRELARMLRSTLLGGIALLQGAADRLE